MGGGEGVSRLLCPSDFHKPNYMIYLLSERQITGPGHINTKITTLLSKEYLFLFGESPVFFVETFFFPPNERWKCFIYVQPFLGLHLFPNH